jgi:hypothetical protein
VPVVPGVGPDPLGLVGVIDVVVSVVAVTDVLGFGVANLAYSLVGGVAGG